MIQKISLIGIILFFSSTFLSSAAAKDNFHSYLTMEEQRSNPRELEIREGPSVKSLEFPLTDDESIMRCSHGGVTLCPMPTVRQALLAMQYLICKL